MTYCVKDLKNPSEKIIKQHLTRTAGRLPRPFSSLITLPDVISASELVPDDAVVRYLVLVHVYRLYWARDNWVVLHFRCGAFNN